jgi:small subunit ribosomal protein S1
MANEEGPHADPEAAGSRALSPAAAPADATETETESGTAAVEPQAQNGAAAGAGRTRGRRSLRNPVLVRAWRTGRPVQGTVERVIKGGYEVRVGRARGFCPHSQIELHREDHPEQRLGKSYAFRVTQVRRGGEDVVLSRRALLEEERADEAKAVRATLIEGAVTVGRAAGLAEFGAFVDLGAGVMGLAHISELAHGHVRRVEDAVSVGQMVQVKILKIRDDGRISLSVRQATDDPWKDAASRFRVGETYPGTVRRLAEFGAFVELAPGVEALAPASEFPPSTADWREGLAPGRTQDWMVLSVDAQQRRVALAPLGPGGGSGPLVVDAVREGRVQRIERYGVFVWLGPGRVGLMPREWTGHGPEVDLRKRYGIGDPVEVVVLEVSDDGRRIRLARPGVQRQEATASAPAAPQKPPRRPPRALEPATTPHEPPGSFGTSLGDKLRAALGRREKPPGDE